MSVLVPWVVAAAFMAVAAVWLGFGLLVVGDDDLPARLAGRARWWRRWAWTVAAACGASVVAGSSAVLVW